MKMESGSKLSINELTENASATYSVDREKRDSESDNSISGSFTLWSTRTRSLLAHVCLVMSFSTILRFIFSLGIYGSAILIPYVVFRILLGIPVVLREVMLGRYVTGPFFKIYSVCPFHIGILVCHFLTTSYVIFSKFYICVHLLKYMASLFRGRILWEHCEKPWATINCFERTDNDTALLQCIQTHNESFCEELNWEISGKQFWQNVIINPINSMSLGFSILFLSIVISAVIVINYKGIKSLEKTLTIFVVVPLVLSLFLSLVTYLTPGSITGFQAIWTMNATLLKKPEVWIVGLTDTVTTLNVGLFVLSFISCHGRFSDDIFYDTLTIFSSDIFCFVLAIPILSIIKSVNDGHPIFQDDFDVYIWISEMFIYYPYPNTFWAFIFYLTMFLFEIGSQAIICLSFFEITIFVFKERFLFSYLLLMLGITLFLLSIPLIFLPTLILCNTARVIIMVICLDLTTFEIFYGIRKFNDDFHFMMGYHPSLLFSCALFIATLLSFIFSLMSMFVPLPEKSFKYEIYFLPIIPVVAYGITAIVQIVRAYKNGNLLQVISENSDWGPSLPLLKKSRIVFDSKTVTKEYMYRKELYKKPLMKPNDFAEQNIVHLI